MIIFYRDFEWKQRKSIIKNLKNPEKCQYCGGSAYIYVNNLLKNIAHIECQDRKFGECRFNDYSQDKDINKVIELWNEHNQVN